MAKDVIITPASGKLDFYGTGGGSVLANINLTDNNDLSLSTTSGNLIIGDASRDVYIGDGTNEVDIVFEQNGEIRSVANKYITVSAGQVNATGIAVNTSSPNAVVHVYGSTPSGTVLNVEGTNGSLFSVVDNLDGTLMSVNNNAGLPVLEVFSDDSVVAGRFGQNDLVVSSSGNVGIGKVPSNDHKLDVNGKINIYNPTALSNSQIYIDDVDGFLTLYAGAGKEILLDNDVTVNGGIVADSFSGDGSDLTGTAASLTVGAVTNGVYTSRSINTTSPISGGGNLSADRTISLSTAYGDTLNPYGSKTAKTFLAAPNASNGVPTFRAIVASDIPTLNQNTTGTAGSANQVANTLTRGSYLTGNNFNGSAATTWAVDATTTATASKVVARDANGHDYRVYGFAQYFNMSHATSTRSSDTIFHSSNDDYIRKNNATGMRASLNVPTRTGGDASGTWSISVTGNAGTVTTNANLTGDVTSTGNATSIAAGVIVNADINTSAAIADTKLATISTAGKVTNSATTATNANTASAIVARDASGNFSAGTITATLTGNASTATILQTARTLTVGSTGKTFNGGGNVSWSLSEIGASPAEVLSTISFTATYGAVYNVSTISNSVTITDPAPIAGGAYRLNILNSNNNNTATIGGLAYQGSSNGPIIRYHDGFSFRSTNTSWNKELVLGTASVTLWTIPLAASSAINFNFQLSAYNGTTSSSASFNIRGLAERNSTGNASIIGSPIIEKMSDSAFNSSTLTVTISTTSIVISGTSFPTTSTKYIMNLLLT